MSDMLTWGCIYAKISLDHMDFIKDPKRASLEWTKNLKETF